jgi:4'-phosphopantetheinyl transferase
MIKNPELLAKPFFDLSEGEVHLWFALPGEFNDPVLVASARDVLDSGEIARMERFRFPEDRRLFLVSHLLVRMALSHYAERSPVQWRFVRNDHGKPQIDPAMGASSLTFSLAHTAGVAVVGVTKERDIGVDVERRDRRVNARGLIRRFFSPAEAAELGKLPSARLRDRFFLYWTLKEAYIKALGRGLSLPLHSFGFQLAGRRPYRIGFTGFPGAEEGKVAGTWRFALISPRPPYIAAMGVASDPAQGVTLRCYRVEPSGEAAPLACVPFVCQTIALSAGVNCIKL